MIGVGTAVGFVYGQVAADATGTWYWPFIFLGLAMAVLNLIMLFAERDPELMLKRETERESLLVSAEQEVV